MRLFFIIFSFVALVFQDLSALDNSSSLNSGNQLNELEHKIAFRSNWNQKVIDKLKLDEEELKILKTGPVLNVTVRVNQAPYSFIENIKPQGYFIDILELMLKGTGIKMMYEAQDGWVKPKEYREGSRVYDVVTSKYESTLASHALLAKHEIGLDTILLNKRKGGVRFLKQLSKLDLLLPTDDLFLNKSIEYDFTPQKSLLSSVADVVRQVSSKSGDFAILDYARSQFYIKRDKVNTLDLIRLSSLYPDFESLKVAIGIGVDKNSPIFPILVKLYKAIPKSEINKIQIKWLRNYKYRKVSIDLPLKFDVHELNFLNEHKVIKYVSSRQNLPFEFLEQNEMHGFTKEVLELFEESTGTKIEFIISDSSSETVKLDTMKRMKAHFYSSYKQGKSSDQTFQTENLIGYHHNYISRYDSPLIKSMADLVGKTLGISYGSGQVRNFAKDHPKVKVKAFAGKRELLTQLSMGKLDAAIAPEWILSCPETSNGFYNLKYNFKTKALNTKNNTNVSFWVNRDHPELASILNKFIQALKAKNFLGLRKKWFGFDFLAISRLLTQENKNEVRIIDDVKKANAFFRLPEMPGLSNDEVKVLQGIHELVIGVESSWLPFSRINPKDVSLHEGLTFDYLERLQKSLNIEFKYVSSKLSKNASRLMKNKEIDLYASSILAGEMKSDFQHTIPYGVYNFSCIVNKKTGDISEQMLNNKRVGINRSYPFVSFLEKAYPEIKFISLPTTKDGIERVHKGDLFAYIDFDPVIKYYLRQNQYRNIKLGTILNAKTSLAISAHKDTSSELISIINKVLNGISNFDKKLIEDRWFTMKVKVEQVTDYTTVIIVASFTVILTLFFVYWNGKLSRLNQVIKEKESLSRSLLESTNAVPYHFDLLKGQYTYIAPQITKLMGYVPSNFDNYEDWALLIHSEDREKVFEKRNITMEMIEAEVSIEYRIKNRNDNFIWVKDMVTIIYERKHPIAIHGLLLDITSEKNQAIAIRAAKEAAESANRSKSQFLANMSHEIRTPLNPIIGLAHLALTTNPSLNQVKDYMTKIQTSSKSLLRIINDILDLSKMEADKLNLEEIPFDLTQLNERISSLYGVKAAEKNIELKFEQEGDVHPYVLGDPLRLEQIIGNLVSNAIKFTDHGSVTLITKTMAKNGGQETVRFIVKDTGLGIPEDKLDKIFEVFAQADDSNTRTHGGTGLGLSICKKLIDMMGGALKAKSKMGHGSEFYFTLNFSMVDVNEYVDHNSSLLEKNVLPRFEATKILLAEDNMINKQVAEELLRAVNLSMDHVRNGKQCVEAVMDGDYELILMDIQMPEMDGFEATKRIRRDERYAKLPIIAMTAQAFASEKKESLAAGMNAHVTKPIDPKDLYETLAKYIKIKEMVSAEEILESHAGNSEVIETKMVDTDGGIKRLRGNESMYRNILLDFKDSYTHVEDEIEAYFEQKQIKEIQLKLHQLKGAAGNVGAMHLFDRSNKLEQCLKQSKPYDLAYSDFKSILNETFREISEWARQSSNVASSDDSTKPVEDLNLLYEQLILEIKDASPNALDTVKVLQNKVSPEQLEWIEKIKESLNEFDFSEALKHCEAFAASHKEMAS